MLIFIIIILAVAITVFLFLQQPIFGGKSKGRRLQRMKRSTHFKNGKFHNLELTPSLGDGYKMHKVMWEFLTKKVIDKLPNAAIPTKKTDLKSQPLDDDFFVWMGHSSYFFQIDKTQFLVDPVLSGNASPIAGTTKAFKGTDVYNDKDFSNIDYLIITHDHYDHLDYKSIKTLKPKIKKVICPLGVGAHLEYWGFAEDQIIELDWHEDALLSHGLKITATPARHFSGRDFRRNTTLWASYILTTERQTLFLGGDSGYGKHFKAIKEKYGPIDWAILENGQYDLRWQYIHSLPEETLQVIEDLGVKKVIPVHSSKFALAMHSWHEPLDKIVANSQHKDFKIYTPMIGEKLDFRNENQAFSTWWKSKELNS